MLNSRKLRHILVFSVVIVTVLVCLLPQVHYSLPRERDENMVTPLPFPTDPTDVRAYGLQVAGHMKTDKERYLGVLQCNNGTILKPIIKESQKREIDFYTRLQTTTQADLLELKAFVPAYYGCRKFTYNGYEQQYLVLENLAERMLEPCIMDVKIGRRTWDPLASEEKIRHEQSKYVACRKQYAFCIPGYQVYKLSSGKLFKYGKEHGKRLQGAAVRAALRNFLNGMETPLCRALLLQLLSQLWRLQRWAHTPATVALTSSSLLLTYDAVRLRECCGEGNNPAVTCREGRGPPARRNSVPSPGAESRASFSGQLSSKGPVYRKLAPVPLSPLSLAQPPFPPPAAPVSSPWSEALDKLTQSHSFEHNYEDKLSKIRMNYRATLDQLGEEAPHPASWGTVKVIDFAHAWFKPEGDEGEVDDNFREGIDNFVAIFEDFLAETDDQVF